MTAFRRWVSSLLILSLLSAPFSWADSTPAIDDCTFHLLPKDTQKVMIHELVETQAKEVGFTAFEGKLFNAIQWNVERKIRQVCQAKSVCTPEELAQVVQSSMEESARGLIKNGKILKRFTGYSIIVGGMVGMSAGINLAGVPLQTEFAWSKAFIAALTNMAVMVFGAPLWERLSAQIRTRSYGLLERRTAIQVDSELGDFLDRTFAALQVRLSGNQQTARSAYSAFYTQVVTAMNQMTLLRRLGNSGDPKVQMEIAGVMANAVIYTRRMFVEQKTNQEDVVRAAHLLFSDGLEQTEREEIRRLVVEKIKTSDPAASDLKLMKHYESVVDTWLNVSPTSGTQ